MKAQSTTVVISQIYGGGGGSGAASSYLYNQDYVELFNLSSTNQDISGWSVQYMSAGTTGVSATASSSVIIPSGTILAPGQYYLVAGPSSSTTATFSGAALPVSADSTAPVNDFAIAANGGKVFLVNTSNYLTKIPTTGCSLASIGGGVVDFVGQNSSTCFSGPTGPAPKPDATSADVRTNPCINTGDNSLDFTVSKTAVPHDFASTPTPCGGTVTPTPPSLTAAVGTSPVTAGGATLLTAKVTKGTNAISSVTVNATAIGGTATTALYDDGPSGGHGDVTAGDLTYSLNYSVPATQGTGTFTLTFTVTDSTGTTATATATVATTASTTPVVPATTVAVSASPSSAVSGTTIGLTATVSGNLGAATIPTGSVNFYDNTVLLGAGTSAGISSGVWTYNASTLGVGSHTITASYSGDTNYPTAVAAATTCSTTVTTNCDTPTTVTVTTPPTADFSVTVSNNNVILNDDQKIFVDKVSVSFLNGFSSAVALTCSGLPSGSRCTFSPTSLSANGTSSMTIAIDGAALHQHGSPFGPKGETALAVTLLALPLALRRRIRQRFGAAGTVFGLMLLGVAIMSATTGCSGTSTPATSSTVTVTAVGGGITHTAGITLITQ